MVGPKSDLRSEEKQLIHDHPEGQDEPTETTRDEQMEKAIFMLSKFKSETKRDHERPRRRQNGCVAGQQPDWIGASEDKVHSNRPHTNEDTSDVEPTCRDSHAMNNRDVQDQELKHHDANRSYAGKAKRGRVGGGMLQSTDRAQRETTVAGAEVQQSIAGNDHQRDDEDQQAR